MDHATIERFERIWAGLSLLLIAVFVTLVFYAVGMHGAHIGHAEPRQHPADILALPEFSAPGVEQTEPGKFRVSMVAQAFSFIPGEFEFPVGAEVTFRTTSRDVIHGLQVVGTPVNLELIPGDIAELTYTFSRPGDFRIICTQYCGIAHHNMHGMIRIVDPDAAPTDEPVAVADAERAWFETGRRVYGAQCAACHQADGSGVPRVFPPLVEHAPKLASRTGGRDYLVDVMLYGIGGEIAVEGVTYRGVMPGLPHLSDADAAAVLNYILHAWDNERALPDGFEPVEPGEVAARRGRGLSFGDMLRRRGDL